MSNGSHIASGDRLGLTLFLALVLHAIVILGISFTLEPAKKEPPPDRTLEILVVRNPQPAKKPKKADFLAQTSQQGGGSEEKKVRPKTLITPPAPQKAARPTPSRQATPPPQAAKPTPPKKVITQKKSASRKVQVVPRKKPKKTKKRKVNIAQLLASSNREIERLTAELDRKQANYAKRPRIKRVTASTQEYKYASYLDAWRKKVERIGNLNYPDEAKRRKLYGSLILRVAIRPDGTVKEIGINKSSGYKLLDDAAIRIVHLSAPFAPFPAEIRKETDIVLIIRTWQFRNNNQLLSK